MRADAPRSGAQAVEVTHLRKAYGETVAVDDVSLSVAEGEIFGILGPNGAGKTTTVECLMGLRSPDAGSIRVMGQEGILRRLATTPLPRSWVLAAPVVINVCLAVVGLIIIFAFGHVAFGLAIPRSPGALALALMLCVAAPFAIGLAIAAVVHVSGLQLVSAGVFLPLVFFAGLWIPRQQMSSVLQHISDYTPLGSAVQATQNAIQGTFPPTRPLLVMVAYALIFGLAAWRLFRWE